MAKEEKQVTIHIYPDAEVYGDNYKKIEGEYICGENEAKRLVEAGVAEFTEEISEDENKIPSEAEVKKMGKEKLLYWTDKLKIDEINSSLTVPELKEILLKKIIELNKPST